MKASLKQCIVSLIFFVGCQYSFPCGYWPYDNTTRVTNFDANVLNFKELQAFTFNSEYLNISQEGERYQWEQNIAQWYAYCGSANETLKADIYNALYGNSKLSTNQNTFLTYIKNHNQEAYNYIINLIGLNLEKVNYHNKSSSFQVIWNDFALGSNSDYRPEQHYRSTEFSIPRVLENLKQCKDPFIKKRWAYQALITAYYDGNPMLVRTLFNQYFTRKNRSWIDNSALHYYALVSQNKDELLLECVIYGYDKVHRNIELLTYSKKFNEAFAQTLSDTTRSYYYFVKCVRTYGRGLPLLKKIYSLHPTNKYLDFLLNREINKVEDWLLSPALLNPSNINGETADDYLTGADNYKADLAYAHNFLAFMKTISKKTLYHDMLIAYLEYLLGNTNTAFDPEKYQNSKNQYIQARIIDFLIHFEQKSMTGKYKEDLMYILDNALLIDKNETSFSYYYFTEQSEQQFMRQQLARHLGYFMTKFRRHRAEGFLIMAKSSFVTNIVWPTFGQNCYSMLHTMASSEDCMEINKLLNTKTPNPYLNFLQVNDIRHQSTHYCNGYIGPKDETYDTLKILDIAAQKYVQQEKFEQAMTIYNSFPSTYWENTCLEMPFILDIGRNKTPINPATQAVFNKLTFLKQFLIYQKKIAYEPHNAQIHFYLANAYYSLSKAGSFWYLSDIYSSYEDITKSNQTTFHKKAISHFNKAYQNSTDSSLRRASLVALGYLGKLQKRDISKEDFLSYTKARENCDLYRQYLRQLSYQYANSSYISLDKPPLLKFKDFDRIDIEY